MNLKLYQYGVWVLFLCGGDSCVNHLYSPRTFHEKQNNDTMEEFWLTSPTQQILIQPQALPIRKGVRAQQEHVIHPDENITYQTIDGFGYTLTGGITLLLNAMTPAKRQDILNELFGTRTNDIGESYLRISISRNPACYISAHASRFVRPRSVRIAPQSLAVLPNVAFKTTEGKIVLIVLNDSPSQKSFPVESARKTFTGTLAAGVVATYMW